MQNGIRQGKESAARTDFIGVRAGGKSFACCDFFWNCFAQLIYVDAGQIQLSYLFLERHAAHQVVNSPFNRLARVEINRSRRRLIPRTSEEDYENRCDAQHSH